MKFAIFTHVPHIKEDNQYFAYTPYVHEMNIWEKYVDEIIVVAPLSKDNKSIIHSSYSHQKQQFIAIPFFDVLSLQSVFHTILNLPKLLWTIFKTMKKADHIHLRCPGNIGLLGCLVQVLFPKKVKTTKYAGNWDSNSKQPWSYRLQKWILNNSFLTRNMRVLVYGEWPNQSKNIVPFFTATYKEADKIAWTPKEKDSKKHFIFVGTLTKGKNPLYAIQIVEALYRKGYDVSLGIYGEGVERDSLENYISENHLKEIVFLKGNHSQAVLKEAYQKSHFVILPSVSEGWPKAITEGMFWGCVPLASKVSCVPFMLDYGNRGLILTMLLENDIQHIQSLIDNQAEFDLKSQEASNWSKQYTIDVFDSAIKKMLMK